MTHIGSVKPQAFIALEALTQSPNFNVKSKFTILF
jgi:hypothetical protein